MKKETIFICCTILMLFTAVGAIDPLGCSKSTAANEKSTSLLVGVYDNRGILMAWFASEYNDIPGQQREYALAKKAGDEKRMKKVVKFQQRLHFMGFGRAPVSQLLKPIEEQLPALAKALGVDVIAFECNYSGDNVKIVDITLDLAKLYDPSPETMKGVREIMAQNPVALEELTHNDQ